MTRDRRACTHTHTHTLTYRYTHTHTHTLTYRYTHTHTHTRTHRHAREGGRRERPSFRWLAYSVALGARLPVRPLSQNKYREIIADRAPPQCM